MHRAMHILNWFMIIWLFDNNYQNYSNIVLNSGVWILMTACERIHMSHTPQQCHTIRSHIILSFLKINPQMNVWSLIMFPVGNLGDEYRISSISELEYNRNHNIIKPNQLTIADGWIDVMIVEYWLYSNTHHTSCVLNTFLWSCIFYLNEWEEKIYIILVRIFF